MWGLCVNWHWDTYNNRLASTDLLKISLSSCSDTNCPRLATKRVEQGALVPPPPPVALPPPAAAAAAAATAAAAAKPGCDDEEPTGLARAGLGRKWGRDPWMDVNAAAAAGCGIDNGGCQDTNKHTTSYNVIQLSDYRVPIYKHQEMQGIVRNHWKTENSPGNKFFKNMEDSDVCLSHSLDNIICMLLIITLIAIWILFNFDKLLNNNKNRWLCYFDIFSLKKFHFKN